MEYEEKLRKEFNLDKYNYLSLITKGLDTNDVNVAKDILAQMLVYVIPTIRYSDYNVSNTIHLAEMFLDVDKYSKYRNK